MTIRIVIVDDHPVVRAGLKAMLAPHTDLEVVGEADDGGAGLAMAIRERPQVVVMDLQMKGTDGFVATAQIRATLPMVQVLVMSTYEAEADIVRALAAGAIGYIAKDAAPHDVAAAIRATARGASALSPTATSRLVARIGVPGLTPREAQIVELVAHGKTNKEVAAALRVAESTVKTHLLSIFAKLGVESRTAAVTEAMARGLVRIS